MGKLEEALKKYKIGDINEYINAIWFKDNEGFSHYLYDMDIPSSGWAVITKKAEFTQDDIKAGMKVQYRNGEYRLVVDFEGELILAGESTFGELYAFNDFYNRVNKDRDIVKVIKPTEPYQMCSDSLSEGEVVWEEKEKIPEVPEFTMEELVIKLVTLKLRNND